VGHPSPTCWRADPPGSDPPPPGPRASYPAASASFSLAQAKARGVRLATLTWRRRKGGGAGACRRAAPGAGGITRSSPASDRGRARCAQHPDADGRAVVEHRGVASAAAALAVISFGFWSGVAIARGPRCTGFPRNLRSVYCHFGMLRGIRGRQLFSARCGWCACRAGSWVQRQA
jgi:hypothetical protein